MIKMKQRPLSQREKQVVKLTLAEYSTREISEALNLHPNTVNTYRRNAMAKLGAESLIGLVKAALEIELLEDDDLLETEADEKP